MSTQSEKQETEIKEVGGVSLDKILKLLQVLVLKELLEEGEKNGNQ
jgi:hypothetical protein